MSYTIRRSAEAEFLLKAIRTSGGSRICQGGGGRRTMASARSASLNGGLGAEPLAGSRGRAPGWGVRLAKSPEAESFLYIFTQKVAKS